ncbi:hypothetical protein TNCV_2355841 [Trichonephila clavipes]|nr:hypothetical protein TNCV_2355841 [Trichonephila clavipes]
MKIERDGTRTYRNCDNCLDIELTAAHSFDCSVILAALQEKGAPFSLINLYVGNFSSRESLRADVGILCRLGAYYRLFSVWTLVPVRLDKQQSGYTTVYEIASEATDRLIWAHQ